MTSKAALVGILLVAGCGGGKGATTCTLPATLTGDNIAQALVLAQVCGSAGCAPIADGVLQQALGSPFIAPLNVALANAIDAGTLFVDVPHAAACLAAIADGCHPQPEPTKLPPECRNVLLPKVPVGGICFTSLDCLTGYCGGSNEAGCPSQCVALGDAGCRAVEDCGAWETCAGGTCGPGASAAQNCTQDSDCALGLACVGTSCAAPGNAGALCSVDSQCASGLFCKSPAGSKTGTCTASLADGQTCMGTGSFLPCGYGSYCSDPAYLVGGSGKCTPYGAAGEVCLQPPGDFYAIPNCQAGLNCDVLDGGSRCVLPPAAGACDPGSGTPCSLSAYCDAKQECQPLRANGALCDEGPVEYYGCASGQCSPGDAGVCVAAGSVCQ